MKSTSLRILALIFASAALWRAVAGCQRSAASPRVATERCGSDFGERAGIVVRGLSFDGPAFSNDARANRNDGDRPLSHACAFDIAAVWLDVGDDNVSEAREQADSAAEPLPVCQNDPFRFARAETEARTCLWDIPDDRSGLIEFIRAYCEITPADCDEPPPVAMIDGQSQAYAYGGEGSDEQRYWRDVAADARAANRGKSPGDGCDDPIPYGSAPPAVLALDRSVSAPGDELSPSPNFGDWEASRTDSGQCIRVEGVEVSNTGQLTLIGFGLEIWSPPVGIGGSDVWCPKIVEETRLMLIGGRAAAAALDRSASERSLPPKSAPDEPSITRSCDYPNPGRSSDSDLFNFLVGRVHLAEFWPGNSTSFTPGRATMSGLVTMIAESLDGRHMLIARDDDTLHLCTRRSGRELCRLKQSSDGVWRVVNPPGSGIVDAGNSSDEPAPSESDAFVTWLQIPNVTPPPEDEPCAPKFCDEKRWPPMLVQ